jgi:polyisoprenoid-binding protein YceI
MTAQAVEIPGFVAGRWVIDRAHSDISFLARHMMVSKVRGHFTEFEGELVIAEDPLQSTATATIDLSSISTNNEMRDNHIRSADFFEVETYPAMTYRSTGISQDGDDFILHGELTLKGVTRAVPLRLEVNGFGPDVRGSIRAGFSAIGEINRMDFGVSYNGPIPGGGVAISETIQILLEVEAILQPDSESPATAE